MILLFFSISNITSKDILAFFKASGRVEFRDEAFLRAAVAELRARNFFAECEIETALRLANDCDRIGVCIPEVNKILEKAGTSTLEKTEAQGFLGEKAAPKVWLKQSKVKDRKAKELSMRKIRKF